MTRARLRAHICMCIRARVPARTREYHKAFQKSIARKGKHKKKSDSISRIQAWEKPLCHDI